MKETNYSFNGKAISYEVTENGYKIYLDGALWITQETPYIPNPSLSYEDGCLKQIEELVTASEKSEDIESRLSAIETGQEVQDEAITELAGLLG